MAGRSGPRGLVHRGLARGDATPPSSSRFPGISSPSRRRRLASRLCAMAFRGGASGRLRCGSPRARGRSGGDAGRDRRESPPGPPAGRCGGVGESDAPSRRPPTGTPLQLPFGASQPCSGGGEPPVRGGLARVILLADRSFFIHPDDGLEPRGYVHRPVGAFCLRDAESIGNHLNAPVRDDSSCR